MIDNSILYVMGILVFFGTIEILSGYLKNSKRTKDDWIQEMGAALVLSAGIKPGIVALVAISGAMILPEYLRFFSELHFFILVMIYLFCDDLLQYCYHRFAHRHPFFWKLHRPHHQAEEMGFFVSYRNAGLYYLLMPNIWWLGIFTYLFGGAAAAVGLVIKQVIIIGSHSTVSWDKPFYRYKMLTPFIRILERIIVTPAFHHAHHGKSKLDGIGDPNANFGNMFSIWDQLFGTAVFSGRFPASYGLPENSKDSWQAAYLFPLVKSGDNKSEISAGFQKERTATKVPLTVNLKKGENYLWCRCGLSQNPPFCDASHHGTKYKPFLFKGEKDGPAKLCNCKITKHEPFCDNSHLKL